MSAGDFALAIHGGAGTIASDRIDPAPFHAGLHAALEAGGAILREGGSALDAVEAAVMVLEDCPLFNAGRGAVYTADATHELDASVMEGTTLKAGAVAGVNRVRNPVQLARRVLENAGPILLAGAGAQRFAEEQGLASEAPAYFHVEHRLAQLRFIQAGGSREDALDHSVHVPAPILEDRKFGTVGAVARDRNGRLAAAVSTGGMTNKRPGRIGDSPIVGAGLYANDRTCAVAATGTGEAFLRAVVAHDIHARMLYRGENLEQAAHAAIHESVSGFNGEGGLVAIDAEGRIAMPFNTRGMYRGVLRAGQEPRTMIHAI
jgi:beta-aspartyl-peptidase (threonine type)